MKLNLAAGDQQVLLLLSTLCNHGEYGDFQAFPSRPLAITLEAAAVALRAAGAGALRSDGERLGFEWHGAEVTVFPSGRMMLEHVSPDRQAAAAEMIQDFWPHLATGLQADSK